MKSYMPHLPSRIVVERGAVAKIEGISKIFGSCPVVVADSVTTDLGGKKIAEALGCKLVLIENSTIEEVKKIESQEADCIISFGGGKVIDVGKLAAHNKSVPFISCPTACSHDGIASGTASITANGQSASFPASAPSAVIADLDILLKSPYRLTASGAADVLSNYCSVEDWKLASKMGEEYSEPIANLALLAANLVSANSIKIKKMEEGGIKNLVWALIFSGMSMSLFGSSRPASGAEHMFSHALDKIGKFGLHGEQVGVGAIFFSYLHKLDWIGITDTLKEIGAPTTAAGIGVSREIFIEAVLKAKGVRKRHTILDEKPLTREVIERVAAETEIF